MWRTLRTKLTLLTTAVAVAVLLVSTFLALHLSTRELETQAREYADLLAHQVALYAETLWDPTRRESFAQGISSLTKDHGNSAAIDVFFFDGVDSQVVSSQPVQAFTPLSQEEQDAVQAGRKLVAHTLREGQQWMSITSPLREKNNQVVGAVRVWVREMGVQRLRIKEASSTLFLAAIFVGGVFFALKVILNYSVSRPLERLTTTMHAAAAGNLSVRAALSGHDDFSQLGEHFNRMLARLEEANTENRQLMTQLQQMNNELEERVTHATQDLVARNRELLRLQREMARVEPLAALGRIMGSIAHELGTPLNSVLGYSQLLAQEDLSQEARESLEVITAQTHRMTDIIQHYLGRTRDAGRNYQSIDINTLIENTVHILKPSFLQHKVQMAMTVAEKLPLIHGESASLQRMLINIINNGIDAMEDGGRLQITTRVSAPTEATQPGVIIEVTDTGNGIPPEVLPHIFEPLVTTKAPGKGTGLGLAICQEIVKSHGGALSISSEVGKGTCAQIFLPIKDHVVRPRQGEKT
ncbi:MAG: sensor histidine kinase [Candidatus Binatia bacterium]